MAINCTVSREHFVFLLMFTSLFMNIVATSETPALILGRPKREVVFRPLFVYKQQERNRQRLWKIHEIYLQQQNSDQQHLENYPTVIINTEYYQQPVALNKPSYAQQYEQQYYQQYYNKYFQQNPQNANNLL